MHTQGEKGREREKSQRKTASEKTPMFSHRRRKSMVEIRREKEGMRQIRER